MAKTQHINGDSVPETQHSGGDSIPETHHSGGDSIPAPRGRRHHCKSQHHHAILLMQSYNLCLWMVLLIDTQHHILTSNIIPIGNMDFLDATFSDHRPITFSVTLPFHTPVTPCLCHCILNSPTTSLFREAFSQTIYIMNDSYQPSAEELVALFYFTCRDILNTIAPFETTQPRVKSQPCLNDSIRGLRCDSRRAEWKWEKKNKIQTYVLEKFQELLTFQSAIKTTQANYFSVLIAEKPTQTQSIASHNKVCCTSTF